MRKGRKGNVKDAVPDGTQGDPLNCVINDQGISEGMTKPVNPSQTSGVCDLDVANYEETTENYHDYDASMANSDPCAVHEGSLKPQLEHSAGQTGMDSASHPPVISSVQSTITLNRNTVHSSSLSSPDVQKSDVDTLRSGASSSIQNTQNARQPVFIKGIHGADILSNPLKIFSELKKIDSRLAPSQVVKGKGALRIDCADNNQSELLLKVSFLGEHPVAVSKLNPSPSSASDLYYQVIIFGVNEIISIEEIVEEASCSSAKRLGNQKPDDSSPPRAVVLTYRCNPPELVYIGYKPHKTKLFIPKPTRCFKCQRFGHISSSCKSGLRCAHCAGTHEYSNCPDLQKPIDERTAKCANCGQNHSAAFKNCNSYNLAKQITLIKTQEKISYAAAATKLQSTGSNPNSNTPSQILDTNLVSTSPSSSSQMSQIHLHGNPVESRPIFSMSDFPELPLSSGSRSLNQAQDQIKQSSSRNVTSASGFSGSCERCNSNSVSLTCATSSSLHDSVNSPCEIQSMSLSNLLKGNVLDSLSREMLLS